MRIISLELNASFDFSLTAGNRQWREQTMGRNQAGEGYLEMILSYLFRAKPHELLRLSPIALLLCKKYNPRPSLQSILI